MILVFWHSIENLFTVSKPTRDEILVSVYNFRRYFTLSLTATIVQDIRKGNYTLDVLCLVLLVHAGEFLRLKLTNYLGYGSFLSSRFK